MTEGGGARCVGASPGSVLVAFFKLGIPPGTIPLPGRERAAWEGMGQQRVRAVPAGSGAAPGLGPVCFAGGDESPVCFAVCSRQGPGRQWQGLPQPCTSPREGHTQGGHRGCSCGRFPRTRCSGVAGVAFGAEFPAPPFLQGDGRAAPLVPPLALTGLPTQALGTGGGQEGTAGSPVPLGTPPPTPPLRPPCR